MTFAGYQVLTRVAQGSSGTVWHAVQLDLGRPVAIKELDPRLLGWPGFLERFRVEARTLADLDNEHVVRVYDYVEEPDRVYLVQEWVDGGPLSDVLLRHGRLAPEQSLGVLRGALTGLAHAHARGLVHGDVSPGNIMVDSAGTSKMVDFGLAVPTGSAGVVGAPTGTPAFSSPEAATGRPVTARSDVYSAAAVLFLLLSGRLPFAGDPGTVLAAHVTAPAPRLTDCGPELADLLARAMAKDPAARPADAAELLAELESAAQRRYGAGWLARSSIAGLVGGSVAAVGAAAVPGGAVAVGGLPAVTTAAAAVTPSAIASGAAQVGGRVLGLPRLALAVAGVVVVAAAATAYALTRPDDGETNTSDAAGQNSEQPVGATEAPPTTTATTTTAAPTTTPQPPIPAVSGTYDVLQTITGAEGATADDVAVGDVQNFTWTLTSTCPSGPCDFGVVSSSGRTYTYAYVGGLWQRSDVVTSECFDQNGAGAPTGVTITLSVEATLQSEAAFDPSLGAPLGTLTGTGSDTTDSDCDGNPATYTYDLLVTRTGD